MELKTFEFTVGMNLETNSPIVVAIDEDKNPRMAGDETFYLKSEADKVIAELKDEINNLKRSLIVARHEVAKARGKKFSNKYGVKSKERK